MASSLAGGTGIPHTVAVKSEPFKLERKDAWWALPLLFSFAMGLWASWQRWGNPLIDAGREMNVPLRLLRGEGLYTQVRYIYGPLSPWLNASLYRLFGVRPSVLCGGGIAATILILALVYWLARHMLKPAEATVAVLAVTWLCAFKPEGNYVLPYAYSALHGCLLDLLMLAILVRYIENRSRICLALAGICAGLAVLAKTEMGIVAIATGAAAVLLIHIPTPRKILPRGLLFLLPGLGVPALVYSLIARHTGWALLTRDSFLFFGNVPWQLIHFNQVRFGLARPWHSVLLMVLMLGRLLGLAGVLAAICLWARGGGIRANRRNSWLLFLGGAVVIAVTSPWLGDLGPLLAMPLILAAMFATGARRYSRELNTSREVSHETVICLLFVIFSLLSLMRVVLRVSTGGALSSVLIPVPMILFVYCWTTIFPARFESAPARKLAWRLAMAVLLIAVVASSVTLMVRYRRKLTYAMVAPHGTMITQPNLGRHL